MPVSAYGQVALGCPAAADRSDSTAQSAENVGIIATNLPQSMTPTKRSEPCWPIGLALLTAWLLPATTARRTAHVSLPRAWAVHLIAVLLTAVLIMFVVAWSKADGALNVGTIASGLQDIIREIATARHRQPIRFPFAVMSVGLMIEITFLGVALLVMPWGACDEPLGSSYRHALRRTWLQTAHVIPIVLSVGTMIVVLDRLGTEWRQANPGPVLLTPPSAVQLPPSDPQYPQAISDHQAALQTYNQQNSQVRQSLRAWRRHQPWYIEYKEPLLVEMGFVLMLWLLWGLLRGVGVSRDVPLITRPPTCEACGYNLTTISLESKCPECGETVLASIGPGNRAGTVWQRRREGGRWAAWRRCAANVLRRPQQFGRQLRLTSPGTDHRLFFALHLPVVFIIAVACMLIFAVSSAGGSEMAEEPVVFLMAISMFGCMCVAGTVTFSLTAALAIGLFESLRHKRNLLPGTIQIACYLGGYLTLWVFFGAVTGLLVLALEASSLFRTLEDYTGIYRDVLATWAWLLPNLACCGGYFILISRGTAGTQHANR